MADNKKAYTFSLDIETMEEAKLIADLKRLNMSRFIEQSIMKQSNRYLKKSQKIARNLLTLYKEDCERAIVGKKPLPSVEAYVDVNKHIFVE